MCVSLYYTKARKVYTIKEGKKEIIKHISTVWWKKLSRVGHLKFSKNIHSHILCNYDPGAYIQGTIVKELNKHFCFSNNAEKYQNDIALLRSCVWLYLSDILIASMIHAINICAITLRLAIQLFLENFLCLRTL